MFVVRTSSLNDFLGWLLFAREVEPLFGPMIDDPSFVDGLRRTICDKKAFCVRNEGCDQQCFLQGGIVISAKTNEILWLAVTQESRGKGIGKALLSEAIRQLRSDEPMAITTFDESVEGGRPARVLYK